jgi:hypothetical protein
MTTTFGLNRQPRGSCKINQPNGLHEASNDSPFKLNGFVTVTFCTTVTSLLRENQVTLARGTEGSDPSSAGSESASAVL